jgi:hypothetical protein
MSSDAMSRAVETLRSRGSNAWLACSVCGGKSLSIALEGTGLGGARGGWESCKSVDDYLLRLNTVDMKTRTALLVRSTHVVLSAQHLLHAGIDHALHKTGFARPIPTLSLHKCRECAIVGQSLRLRPDAKMGLGTEAQLMETIVRSRMVDDKLAHLLCSSESCTGVIAKGALLPFRTGADETAQPLAQMLHFSRKGKGVLQNGIIVWVVMEKLPVVVLDDFAVLFKTGDFLRTLNMQCNRHAAVFPRKCVVCNAEIATRLDAAFLGVDSKTAPMPHHVHAAHFLRCVHPCKMCGVWVPKVAPTFEEAMESEISVAMHARCHEFEACAARSKELAQTKNLNSAQNSPFTSFPLERLSVTHIKQPEPRGGSLFAPTSARGRQLNCDEMEIDGIKPGDEKVVWRSGNTFARKQNVNGKIQYLPLDGQAFRGQDGRIEFYEYGVRVSPVP